MTNTNRSELAAKSISETRQDLQNVLRLAGPPSGCVFGAVGAVVVPSYELRYTTPAFVRISKEPLGICGQVRVDLYTNLDDIDSAYAEGRTAVEGIGDRCAVKITPTQRIGDFVNAWLKIENIEIYASFPVEGDYREYLLKLNHVFARYLRSPDSPIDEIDQLDEMVKREAEELTRHIGDSIVKREAEAASRRKGELEQFTATLTQLLTQHIRTLVAKRMRSVTRDDYGNIFDEKWKTEIRYFLANVVGRVLPMPEWFGDSECFDAIQLIESRVIAYQENQEQDMNPASVSIDQMSPLEFEQLCAQILRKNGWDATLTQASGDQGIDIIALRGNKKAVLQCKKYAKPVGNGAVQEIIAGKQFERADIAVVVSNASFTKSAKILAHTAGVFLLHYSELDEFGERATSA